MAALPYMQLYVADYLADTTHLSAAQHGAYLLLLMNYWQRGKALPDSNTRLAAVARMSEQEFNSCREVLIEFFDLIDGQWFHWRVERDLAAVKGVPENKRKAGLASAAARKARNQQESNSCSTPVPTPAPTAVPTAVQQQPNNTDQIQNRSDTEKNRADVLEPSMAASLLMQRLAISGKWLPGILTDVLKAEDKQGKPLHEVVDAMEAAWNEYQLARSKLDFASGAEKFFGEGKWRNKATWGWKPGQEPPASGRKYANA